MLRLVIPVIVFAAFTAWSSFVTWDQGYWGFLDVAVSGGWQSQVFVDLCIALTLVGAALIRDARQEGIRAWPYLLLFPFLGSIAPLAYVCHRQWRRLRG